MVCSVSVSQIELILKTESGNPHEILGMHVINYKGKTAVAVREFIPSACKITVKDAKSGSLYVMEKVHDDGFFEIIVPRRKKYFKYKLLVDFGKGNVWETDDQYTFEPTISEYDRYLFNSGTHYEIYEKLGAHIKTINGTKGTSFAVWAPNAKSVTVAGTFNGWDERRSQMRMLGESGIWEIFIPGAGENDIYKYRVKSQSGAVVEKSDPYGFLMQLRPKTGSIVYDIEKYKWDDSQWLESRKSGRYDKPLNIYEVHMGSWRRYGNENRFMTYREAAEDLLNYVVDMGYTHIEFLPLSEHPFDGSWGYQVTGYFAPTSRYGTPEELMYLIDKCHQKGIGVILDWVPAHFPKDSFGLARFDGTALYEHQDPRLGEHLEWGTYIFNYGRKEVSNFLISNALYWAEKYHVDGLRVDAVASMLYLDYCRSDGQWIPNKYGGRENLEAVEFMKHLNSVMHSRNAGVMMMAEESTAWEGVTRDVKYNGLGFTFKWNMGWMNDFLSYIKKETVYRKYHHNTLTFSMVYNYNENFILVLSHDEVVHLKGSMINKMPGDMWQKAANLRVAYGFMYSHPGKKLLFMGNEIAQFSEWSEARSLDWHLLEFDTHKNIQKYMKELNRFYMSNSALWQKDFDPNFFRWIDSNDGERSLLSFERRSESESLVVLCNFTESVHTGYRLGVPQNGTYTEIFNSDKTDFGGSGVINEGTFESSQVWSGSCENSIQITVPPLGICIFKKI